MRIDVDQGKRAEALPVRPQQRQADRVVAPQRQHRRSGGKQGTDLGLDIAHRVFDRRRDHVDIAAVDDAQTVERPHLQGVVVAPQKQRRLPNGARSEAARRCGRELPEIKRHAHDRQVAGADLASHRAAHEGGNPGEGLELGAMGARVGSIHVGLLEQTA